MSSNRNRKPIEPFKLFDNFRSQLAPIYVPLLIIYTLPILLNLILPKGESTLGSVIGWVFVVGVLPIMNGTAIYFVDRYLQQGQIDLIAAFQQTIDRLIPAILGQFLYFVLVNAGILSLFLPGIYIAVTFAWMTHTIILENRAPIDSFKYSFNLVKGRWWSVFGAMLVGAFILIVPLLIWGGITSWIYRGHLFATGGSLFAGVTIGDAKPLSVRIIEDIFRQLLIPPVILYYGKLYRQLRSTADLNT
jgi:hypothetical protein